MRRVLGGTWNMERDRDKRMAAASALALMRSKGLTFLCIQECAGYLATLREYARDEFDVISFDVDPGRAESAIIVRADVNHGHGYQVRATRGGWFTVRGGKTPPKYLTTVQVDGWLRIASVHTAPSVSWRAGRITGPVRRVASMRQLARTVVRFALRRRGPLLIAGDWNATPDAQGRYSPHWIGRKSGLHVKAPEKGTHGYRVIDFALVRDCSVTATREKPRGSDHHAVVFKVTAP